MRVSQGSPKVLKEDGVSGETGQRRVEAYRTAAFVHFVSGCGCQERSGDGARGGQLARHYVPELLQAGGSGRRQAVVRRHARGEWEESQQLKEEGSRLPAAKAEAEEAGAGKSAEGVRVDS